MPIHDSRPKLSREVAEKAAGFKFAKLVLFSAHLALNEPLKYTSAKFNPDIDLGFNYNVGLESIPDFEAHLREERGSSAPEARDAVRRSDSP